MSCLRAPWQNGPYMISTVNTTPDICTGDIWQHKMQVRGDFFKTATRHWQKCCKCNINWRDVQTKNVVNNVDMACLRAPWQNIYTSIYIASISFTGRMKLIPRWTPLALSPRKGTENTNDVRNSPLFLECCYFKIASTRCKAILIASLNKFRISQYRLMLLLFTSFYSVYVQFNQKKFT